MNKKILMLSLTATLILLSMLLIFPMSASTTKDTAKVSQSTSNSTTIHGGLHSIYELNTEDDELDSHSGVTHISTLELDWRNSYFIDSEDMLEDGYLWYPRIKRLSSGRYILFFQDGRWGPNIYYTHSDDGYTWEDPTVLFAKHRTYNDRYWRYYATCDAIELDDGTIVVAAIFHPNRVTSNDVPSRWEMSERGIVTKYSKDGGYSWSEQQIIYNGRCWEPSFLQLPDGTVQMYFTQSAPKDAMYTTLMNDSSGSHVSSGVGLITSKDGGKTWSPMSTSFPYITSRIAQQYIYTNQNGVKIMTDQMPVAVLLHDNKTIVMAVESLTSFGKGHKTSIVRSHDFFATSLQENETGPYDRDNMLLPGPAPYIVQFPSGEIAVTNTKKAYLGNELGTEFNTTRGFNLYPHQSQATWGDMFVIDSHVVVASAGDTIIESSGTNLRTNGIGISRLILDHRIDAKTAKMTVDANTIDWYDNTDALFVGSINQAQTSIRVAHDSENVYFLFEHLDYYLNSTDEFVFFVAPDNSSNIKYRVKANHAGAYEIVKISGNSTTDVSGTSSAVKLYGTINNNSDTDEGMVIEFSIPKSAFGGADTLRVFMKMYGNDGRETYAWDGFNGVTEGTLSTWHMVRLSKDTANTTPSTDDTTPPTDTTASDTTSTVSSTTTDKATDLVTDTTAEQSTGSDSSIHIETDTASPAPETDKITDAPKDTDVTLPSSDTTGEVDTDFSTQGIPNTSSLSVTDSVIIAICIAVIICCTVASIIILSKAKKK